MACCSSGVGDWAEDSLPKLGSTLRIQCENPLLKLNNSKYGHNKSDYLCIIIAIKKRVVFLCWPPLAFQLLVFCNCYYSPSCSNIQLSLTSIFYELAVGSGAFYEVSEVFHLLNNNENISVGCNYFNGFFASILRVTQGLK